MRKFIQAVHQRALTRSMRFGRRLAHDENGVTAIEFAMVGIPFFMMLFGIMGVGFYFFSIFNIENAIEQASRPLRTGEAQKASTTKVQFSKAVCDQLAGFFDCQSTSSTNKMRIQVVNVTALQAATAGALPAIGQCIGKDKDALGNFVGPDILIPDNQTVYQVPNATQTVVVTVCYEMDLLQNIPFIKLGNMPSGTTMIQASTAFKTEPY
jgi:Flp pilus assembly protein TadG